MEAVDWKRRHLDALREMEQEERRWREVESLLRRVVARLCRAAHGRGPQLDERLDAVAAAVRDGDDAALRGLFDSLTDAIRALEHGPVGRPPQADRGQVPGQSEAVAVTAGPAAAVAADPPPPPDPAVALATAAVLRWKASCAAVDVLLQKLAGTTAGEDVERLRRAAAGATRDDELAAVLAKVAGLVATRTEAIARERLAAAAVLAQVTARLDEVATYIRVASRDRAASRAATDALNSGVLSQVDRLALEVGATQDLEALRRLVGERLDAVGRQVREYHAREMERHALDASRAERLQARIEELERETRALTHDLDREKERARIDPLTRVPNRAAFDERFAEEIARWERFGTPVSVLVLDVDRFKGINDRYGHRTGDAALREVANCLDQRRRATDLLARFGGEEFVMLLVGTPLAQAEQVADELRERVAACRFHFRGAPVAITVSCGLTELRAGDEGPSVFDRADAALYRAKAEGRNRCVAA